MEYSIAKNETYNSIEIAFNGKPDEKTREILKANRFRWHGLRRVWYGYADEQTIRDQLDGGTAKATSEQPKREKVANKLPSLWERCGTSKIKQHDKNTLPPVKEIAAILRKELRARFPEVKFSITSTYNTIAAYIQASPYGRERILKDRRTGEPDPYGYWQNSDELEAVRTYCKALASSWNYDDSDTMTDYFDVHFYGGYFEISGGYVQTAATEEQLADIADFKAKKTAEDEAKQAALIERAKQAAKEREEQAKRYEEQRRIDAENAEAIEKHVKITDFDESEQIAVLGLREYCKICNLDEMDKIDDENVRNNEEQPTTDAVISRRVDFTNSAIFANFCKMFMNDFTFLAGKGGTGTADYRPEASDISSNLTAKQRETVKYFATDCIGVYFNDVLQFVIDPQGFSYARYVLALPSDFDEETDTANAKEWRDELRRQSEKLPPFYIPAPIVEQIETANLQPGEQITVLRVEEWILISQELRGTLESIEAKPWAQYSDAGSLTYKPAGKRIPETLHFHKGQAFAVYRGTLPEVPNVLKYGDVSGGLQLVKFAGSGADGYLESVIKYYEKIGYKPIIDLIAK